MSEELTFLNAQDLLGRLNGRLGNILLTGRAGVGKSRLADSFTKEYGEVTTYCSVETGGSKETLKHDLKFTRNQILIRRSLARDVSAKLFLIIDESDVYVDTLANSEDFSAIIEYGESVGIYVILISQEKHSLLGIGDETFNRFVHIEL